MAVLLQQLEATCRQVFSKQVGAGGVLVQASRMAAAAGGGRRHESEAPLGAAAPMHSG